MSADDVALQYVAGPTSGAGCGLRISAMSNTQITGSVEKRSVCNSNAAHMLPYATGLHSSTYLAQRKPFLWVTLVGVNLTVAKTTQVELNHGRV